MRKSTLAVLFLAVLYLLSFGIAAQAVAPTVVAIGLANVPLPLYGPGLTNATDLTYLVLFDHSIVPKAMSSY